MSILPLIGLWWPKVKGQDHGNVIKRVFLDITLHITHIERSSWCNFLQTNPQVHCIATTSGLCSSRPSARSRAWHSCNQILLIAYLKLSINGHAEPCKPDHSPSHYTVLSRTKKKVFEGAILTAYFNQSYLISQREINFVLPHDNQVIKV